VAAFDLRPKRGVAADGQPWSLPSLTRIKRAYEAAGFRVEAIESRPPMEKIKLGLPGRDEELAVVSELVANMGALGIPVWCYEWMPVLNWVRTRHRFPPAVGRWPPASTSPR